MPTQVDLTPDTLDLVLYAGDMGDFQLDFIGDDGLAMDMTPWTFKAQIRKFRGSSQVVDLSIDMSKANFGMIIVNIPAGITRNLGQDLWNRNSQWDLQCQSSISDPITILQGNVYCSKDVTL